MGEIQERSCASPRCQAGSHCVDERVLVLRSAHRRTWRSYKIWAIPRAELIFNVQGTLQDLRAAIPDQASLRTTGNGLDIQPQAQLVLVDPARNAKSGGGSNNCGPIIFAGSRCNCPNMASRDLVSSRSSAQPGQGICSQRLVSENRRSKSLRSALTDVELSQA